MRGILAAVFTALLIAPCNTHASGDNIDIEKTLSEILQDKRLEDAKERGDISGRDTSRGEETERQRKDEQQEQEGGGKKEGRRAILPQVGFSPEKGGNGGVKLTDRDIQGLTLDVSALAAQKGQVKGHFRLVAPDILSGRVILLIGAQYQIDPTKEFFGLGNNDVGPDELSTNQYQNVSGVVAAAVRLTRRFTLVASGAYNEVQIHNGDREGSTPSTGVLFPRLAGIGGGKTSPISGALIFDDRDDVTRPTRGWNVIAKYQRIDRGLGNQFDFNRFIFEASYLYPLPTRRQIIGLRAGGEYIDTKSRQTPFFEYSSLGGGDDLRGYFKDRFLGEAKVIAGGEYRIKIFDFRLIWDVKIDGVGFFDAARVFLDRDDLAAEFGEDESTLPRTSDEMRFSYGPGLRIALGEAILARLDIGFSDEEKGLVYLVFGHTF